MINGENSLFITWNDFSYKRYRLITDHQPGGWKPYASKKDTELFERGQIGNDELKIIPVTLQSHRSWYLEEWYYFFRLLESDFVQIGWEITGFNSSITIEIANDKYS
ncbi:unnamed protein product [Rotaria sp. Silwood2]|nr:unnamed protein product [Rotaria sp. Silwood2]CAF2844102.1 unnamed protein product [Rotaria sp. Silwood2]CAF3161225.1 unnamed protein product [Rotaria sp. Silwood2]CAF3204035.1 unnamed protein product [Rotaria sp. Silwood2]CAF3960724.1 unnamed protein product [Rotaria sp. Silwood2]